MSETFDRIRELVMANDYLVSDHGYAELQNDQIVIEQLLVSLLTGELIEDYPDFHKGPSVLVLSSTEGKPIHSVWGIAKGQTRPAWLTTAYRPDPKKWLPDWKTRRAK